MGRVAGVATGGGMPGGVGAGLGRAVTHITENSGLVKCTAIRGPNLVVVCAGLHAVGVAVR